MTSDLFKVMICMVDFHRYKLIAVGPDDITSGSSLYSVVVWPTGITVMQDQHYTLKLPKRKHANVIDLIVVAVL